jgi:hypothetical protein
MTRVQSCAARLAFLRCPFGVFSVLVRNQPGEVLKAVLLNGDLAAAERNLDAECGDESLYGGKVRLFTKDSLRSFFSSSFIRSCCRTWRSRNLGLLADYDFQKW